MPVIRLVTFVDRLRTEPSIGVGVPSCNLRQPDSYVRDPALVGVP